MPDTTSYDSLTAWLRHAPEDEIAEQICARYSTEELLEIVAALDRLLEANPEQ
jgi:hypothetical protein